jgi:hypothetical protein
VLLRYGNSGGYKKNNNQGSSELPIYNFSQQHLDGAANWSAAKDGQVLPYFDQILSGA